VTDSFFLTVTDLIIEILDENNNSPVFKSTPYVVQISEESLPTSALLRLSASDDDKFTHNFVFECYSTPYLDKSYFSLNPETGELFLTKPLDRDLPTGMPIYYLPVSVTDNGAGAKKNLTTYTTVKIILDDINDNAPVLAYDVAPLIIEEGNGFGSVEFFVIDVDTPKNGPKFNFALTSYTDVFELKEVNCDANCNDREKYEIISKTPLDREVKPFYLVAYTVQDKGGLARSGVIKIVVGDVNNNAQFAGSKRIAITSYENSLEPDLYLGTLYVKDKDDWNQIFKQADSCKGSPNVFDIKSGLQIFGPNSFKNFPQNVNTLECSLTDSKTNSIVQSNADFSLNNIDYNDLVDPAAVRLFGITPENLAKKVETTDTSLLDSLIQKLINILSINPQQDPKENFLKLITLREFTVPTQLIVPNQIPDFDLTKFGSDLYFYAKKNGRLISARQIYSQLSSSLSLLSSSAYTFDLNSFLFDICQLQENKVDSFCPSDSQCKQSFMSSRQVITVDANATSIVSMDNQLSPQCFSRVNRITECFNGGKRVGSQGGSDFYCECPDYTEGPRCEVLSLTFKFSASSPSHSFAQFDAFDLTSPLRIEFDFTTDREKGLLLFNGPLNRESTRFIAAEINRTALIIHVGLSKIVFPEVNVSDKRWHHVDILLSQDGFQVVLDKCNSKHATIADYDQFLADQFDTDVSKLSLGGIPPTISNNHFYYSLLDVYEYEGCIRNLRVNGDLRNLKLSNNPDEYNLAQDGQQCDCLYRHICQIVKDKYTSEHNPFPWWIILIIVGTLLLLALILALAILSIRRKDTQKKMLQMFPDDDIRETIINYADGAGEENTENFNIGVIKKPIGQMVQTVNLNKQSCVNISGRAVCGGAACGGAGCGAANCGSEKANLELCTNDQNMIYAYEGEGSEAGSLSSLVSNKSDVDQEFEYIKEWGPKFYKLSNIFVSNSNTTNNINNLNSNNKNNYNTNNGNINMHPPPPSMMHEETKVYQSSNYQFETRQMQEPPSNYYN
jgi:hypothetical protein